VTESAIHPKTALKLADTDESPIRVVYVMGAGRSGSTVLDTILNNHEDVIGVGELVHLFIEGSAQKENCSCGESRDTCEIWHSVRERWSELTGIASITEHERLMTKFTRVQRLAIPEWHRLRPGNSDPDFAECLRQTQATYQAIADATGKRVIIESSKNPLRAKLLCLTPGLDVRMVHMVRDVRGVVWSRMKPFAKSKEGGVPRDMKPKPIHLATGYWMFMNFLSERVRRAFPDQPSTRIHYEDFVTSPEQTLKEIGKTAGLDYSLVAQRLAAGDAMAPGHLYAGNRVRTAGPITLRSDMEWMKRLTPGQQRLTWLLAGHQLRQYGYHRRPSDSNTGNVNDPQPAESIVNAA
jgi:hypothetical protein